MHALGFSCLVRISRIAEYVNKDQILISTYCVFARIKEDNEIICGDNLMKNWVMMS